MPRKKRFSKLLSLGHKDVELTKVTQISLSDPDKEFVYFDRLPDGSWRLCYTEGTLPENFEGINIKDGK